MVGKLLISLLMNQWGAKFMTIEEAQNLKTLKLEDLGEKLLTWDPPVERERIIIGNKLALKARVHGLKN